MDNYPDDIRKYDNDPRSPFYVSERWDELAWLCPVCDEIQPED
jgi:hypothetical protein